MNKYNEDLDYLIQDVDISKVELAEIITKADKIISDVDSDEKRIEPYLKKVQCLQKLNKYDESKEFIDKLLVVNPNMPEALVHLGIFYDEKKEYKKAIDSIGKAIKKKPEYVYAYINRGWTYYDEGKYDKAIKDSQTAIEKKSNYYPAFNLWGSALFQLAKIKEDKTLFEDSFKQYAKATEINPKCDFAFNNWKIVLSQLEELQKTKNPFSDSFVKSANDNYKTSILYATYERLHLTLDENLKTPDYEQEINNFLVKVGNNPIRLAEHYLLISLIKYLHDKAPEDEQNLFMVVELIDAGKKEKGYDSDLDRLFDMLDKKKAEDMVLRSYYEKFCFTANEDVNDIISSCRKHFCMIGRKNDFFKYINNNDDLHLLAKIIIKTFAKPNSRGELYLYIDKLYHYLIELYDNSKKSKIPVHVKAIEIKLDEIDKLKEFYREVSDDDEVDDENKVNIKQNLENKDLEENNNEDKSEKKNTGKDNSVRITLEKAQKNETTYTEKIKFDLKQMNLKFKENELNNKNTEDKQSTDVQ
jgi:lipoprotein NlpI